MGFEDAVGVGISFFTGFLGGATLERMSIKKQNNSNEDNSPKSETTSKSGDKVKTKVSVPSTGPPIKASEIITIPSKAPKDNQKASNNSSKPEKHKTESHPPKTPTTKTSGQTIGQKKSNEMATNADDDEYAASRMKTVPYDPRFPNQNQTRCLKVKNDEEYCHYYQWAYHELCPKAWYEKWDDQRERDVFPGQI